MRLVAITATLLLTLTACNSPIGKIACGGWCGGGISAADQMRYGPAGKGRDDAYEACLFATAGKGREPFDTCMAEKGYTR